MAYSINPNLPKARAIAMRLLIAEGLPSAVVANKCGVHRSTIWRWKQKWLELNKYVQFDNPNRPGRILSLKNKLQACQWRIATRSSRPHVSPQAICKAVVLRVLELRATLRRCAEVIWHHLVTIDRMHISLSSVHRILKRHHAYDGARKNRVRPDNPDRPLPAKPGELVQTDTIHYVCPLTYKRRYVYTVIDIYTRMAYAEIHDHIRPGIAADVVGRAQEAVGFRFSLVQSDNGPEFGRYFEQTLARSGIRVRHSRLGRPNDNAHIERFNRTIQEECLGSRISSRVATATLRAKIQDYIEFYNTKRVHLGLQLRIPADMLQRS
jgi:transposase InsO family protein